MVNKTIITHVYVIIKDSHPTTTCSVVQCCPSVMWHRNILFSILRTYIVAVNTIHISGSLRRVKIWDNTYYIEMFIHYFKIHVVKWLWYITDNLLMLFKRNIVFPEKQYWRFQLSEDKTKNDRICEVQPMFNPRKFI